MAHILISKSPFKKKLNHEENTGKLLIIDKYYFFQTQSNARFIIQIH